MPSLETARRVALTKYNGAKTVGQIHKEQSDFIMERTWDNDIQSKVCYIYDYFHDDQKHLNKHMTYRNTTKTKIDAKFIVKSYQSIDKDQVEYYVQFKPSQKTEFCVEDELFYFETDYRDKYGNDDFIGLYLDIPDDKGVYRKWIIAKKEIANQFVKYLILPCNYELMWIEKNGKERIKRRMWSVLRNQNSYNSGLWTDFNFTSQENQNKCWLPLNTITEKIWYTNDSSQNMRVLVSAYVDTPTAWTISKVENANNIGVQMLTLYQDHFDQHRDFIERDDNGKIIGLWANYYDLDNNKINPVEPSKSNELSDCIENYIINASTSFIKIGGSYKTLTLKVFDSYKNDITEKYSNATLEWFCEIDGKDFTNSDLILWRDFGSFNQKKIKISNDRSYLDKIATIGCRIKLENSNTHQTTTQFELII